MDLRYEWVSVMITTNLPSSRWAGIFKDPTTTAAAIDRLVHHSVIIELNLESHRLEESRKNQKASLDSIQAPKPHSPPEPALPREGTTPQQKSETERRRRRKAQNRKSREKQERNPHPHGQGNNPPGRMVVADREE